jgi:hypothetical protein
MEVLAPRNPFPSVLDRPAGATGSRAPLIKGPKTGKELAAIEKKIVSEIGDALSRLRARMDAVDARAALKREPQSARAKASKRWGLRS